MQYAMLTILLLLESKLIIIKIIVAKLLLNKAYTFTLHMHTHTLHTCTHTHTQMGFGDLSPYGHPTSFTPNIQRMADDGLVLTNFYTNSPVCSPSR